MKNRKVKCDNIKEFQEAVLDNCDQVSYTSCGECTLFLSFHNGETFDNAFFVCDCKEDCKEILDFLKENNIKYKLVV